MADGLPAEVTSFVGRRTELAELRRQLSAARLVTLVGMGGVGKTRLAVRAAGELRRLFPDGVRFVELAMLSGPALLPQTVAAACGLRDEAAEPMSRLVEHLADKRMLLVLDNCEHVAEACAVIIGKVLAAAPDVRIVATSRQRLLVEGEHLVLVEPLSVPSAEVPAGSGKVAGLDAVTLFADRAVAVSPEFSMTTENRRMVERICRRLDGLPLAIELAAVWVRVLSLQELYDRLDDKFSLLGGASRAAPPRQQGLEALLDWSYRLCSPREQAIWAKLSVFRGGFELRAVEAVCADGGVRAAEILDVIAALVDKSVLIREADTYGRNARFQMLSVLSEFGANRLAEFGESAVAAARHRGYYRELAAEYSRAEFSAAQHELIVRLEREHPNLRVALASGIASGELRHAMAMAANLTSYWLASGRLAEGSRWLDQMLDDDDGHPSPERARALHTWLTLRTWLGVDSSFPVRLAEYRAVVEAFDDTRALAALGALEGIARYFLGEPSEARAMLEEALPRCREHDDHSLTLQVLVYLSTLRFLAETTDHDASRQAMELCETHGRPPWHTAYALWALGLTALREGDVTRARSSVREAIRVRIPLRDYSGIALSLETLAWCAAGEEQFTGAARLLGAAKTGWRLSGAGRVEPTLRQVSRRRCVQPASSALGAEVFEAEFAAGAGLAIEEAITLALGERRRRAPTQVATVDRSTPLTTRELEVAELVARGLSNRQIAAQLVISQRTADTHVQHILTKLGFTSRARIAAWLATMDVPNER